MKTKTFGLHSFKALSEPEGIFEAIVAVFGNVDRYREVVVPGAFANTLDRWLEKGRPIPVIWSHQWDNLDAHVGQVLVAREVPEGLYVKGQMDLVEEFASRLFKKMLAGLVAEFSFAYDVKQAAEVDRGPEAAPRFIYELRELELFEVGPCLVGVNPETELISAKAGARHTRAEYEMLQSIHDMVCALGAKCDAGDEVEEEDEAAADEAEGGGKSRLHAGTLAVRSAIELEEMGAE